MSQREYIHDLIGVGFGPSNLALAVRLAENGGAPGAHCFIERQPEFGWHRGMLLDDSRMQISFLKDLVTMRDPKSRFTFINYLFERGRLQDFVNLKNFYPTRIEFHDYLRWVASAFDDQVHYGESVTQIEPVTDENEPRTVTHLRVHSRDAQGKERHRLTRCTSRVARPARRCIGQTRRAMRSRARLHARDAGAFPAAHLFARVL